MHKKPIPGPSLFDRFLAPPQNPCLAQLKLAQEYGKFCQISGIMGYYLLSHPDYIEHILKTNYKNYIKTDIAYKGIRRVVGDGLLAIADNDLWLTHRRLLQPSFQPHHLDQFTPTIVETTLTSSARWETYATQNKTFNLSTEMLELLFNIATNSLFSGDFVQYSPQLLRLTRLGNKYIGKALFLYPWLPTILNLRFWHSEKQANRIILDVIAKRRSDPTQKNDLLTTLLTAKNAKGEPGFAPETILDEVKTFLITGHETTGTALSWAFYLLATHPAETAILQQELAEVLKGNPPTLSDLEKLPYLRMVCEETLRIYPPIWLISRCAVAEDEIDGYAIPANKTIIISPFVMHHLPDYWEEPFKFNPLRFSEANKNLRPKFAYLPFGVGPRSCIGNAFALLQMQLIVAIIMQKYTLTSTLSKPIKYDPLITLKPHNGVWVKIQKR